jgi:hypothetical protein
LLSNNDLGGTGHVAIGTLSGLTSTARSRPRLGPVFTGTRLIAACAARLAAGLLPERKASATLTLSMQDGLQIIGQTRGNRPSPAAASLGSDRWVIGCPA